jgi:hypothetical protein
MNVSLEQIRTAVTAYISETGELRNVPEDLLSLLENADHEAKSTAESIEGILALYAVGRISGDSLKTRLADLLKGMALTVPVTSSPSYENALGLAPVPTRYELASVLRELHFDYPGSPLSLQPGSYGWGMSYWPSLRGDYLLFPPSPDGFVYFVSPVQGQVRSELLPVEPRPNELSYENRFTKAA